MLGFSSEVTYLLDGKELKEEGKGKTSSTNPMEAMDNIVYMVLDNLSLYEFNKSLHTRLGFDVKILAVKYQLEGFEPVIVDGKRAERLFLKFYW